jgi:glycine/D-amino acid oxidase-like deaminating enzyme
MAGSTQTNGTTTETAPVEQYDAIIIGAGVSGLYQLDCLRQLGLNVRLFEDGDGVGGTWYWNRYPGCRFDSESETYGYFCLLVLVGTWSSCLLSRTSMLFGKSMT